MVCLTSLLFEGEICFEEKTFSEKKNGMSFCLSRRPTGGSRDVFVLSAGGLDL